MRSRVGWVVWAFAVGCASGGGNGASGDAGLHRGDDAGREASRDAPVPARDAHVADHPEPGHEAGPPDAASEGGDAALPTTCSDGAPIAYTRATCPGAPGAIPGPLLSQAGFNTRGETLDLDGLTETTLPCIPSIVCVSQAAPTMLFSDDPESPSSDGVLYADVIGPGPFRAYVYHANAGAGLRKFPVVLLNQGSVAVNVTLTAEGIAGPSQDYIAVGKQAIQSWFASQGTSLASFSIPPGERVLLDPNLDAVHAGMNELAHGIIDFTLDGPVKASVVSVVDTEDATVVTAGLSLLGNDGLHVRGTFPGASLEIEGTVPVDQEGARRLRLGGGVTDATLTGHDYVDDTSVTLDGNYGVVYTFKLALTGNTSFVLSPQGGAWGGVTSESGGIDGPAGVTLLPSAADSLDIQTEAIVLGIFPTGAVSGLGLMSAGGSSLPVDLLTIPLAP